MCVCAIDVVDVFLSKVKLCEKCLTREVGESKEIQYFHKAVACMAVGSGSHIALGMEMLKPWQDGSEKDKGEMTGAKHLLERLRCQHHHFSDVIVTDALYMNAPFINLASSIGMYSVIRAKNTRLNIVKDALRLFKKQVPITSFTSKKKHVEVWGDDHFSMEGTGENIKVLKFIETWIPPNGKEQKREMWCITTLPKGISAETVWLIMCKRWKQGILNA